MIRYALHCEHGHAFESWFQNSSAYDKQIKRALITCPVCNSAKVEKAIMSPRLGRAEAAEALISPPTAPPTAPAPSLPMPVMSAPERELRKKLKELREHITKNADYVGKGFPEQARKIHYGEIEHRSIYGEASAEEAKALHEEGVEFHPLPILPDEFN
jgi:hypothetical protein